LTQLPTRVTRAQFDELPTLQSSNATVSEHSLDETRVCCLGGRPERWQEFVRLINKRFSETHREQTVGFLFPAVARGKNQAKNMNSEDNEDRRKLGTPANRRINNPLIRALREVYAAIGLTPDLALRSALADYECQFEPAIRCAA